MKMQYTSITYIPRLDRLHKHTHAPPGVLSIHKHTLSACFTYTQLLCLLHQGGMSILSRNGRIADCTVRHSVVEHPFYSLKFERVCSLALVCTPPSPAFSHQYTFVLCETYVTIHITCLRMLSSTFSYSYMHFPTMPCLCFSRFIAEGTTRRINI